MAYTQPTRVHKKQIEWINNEQNFKLPSFFHYQAFPISKPIASWSETNSISA